jgi:hypothetical protein
MQPRTSIQMARLHTFCIAATTSLPETASAAAELPVEPAGQVLGYIQSTLLATPIRTCWNFSCAARKSVCTCLMALVSDLPFVPPTSTRSSRPNCTQSADMHTSALQATGPTVRGMHELEE